MATDIRLDEGDGNWLIVDSAVLKSTASDFMLDAPGRNASGGHRRALVHDSGDGLTVNFNGDYPGGVTLAGNVRVGGTLTVGDNADDLIDSIADLRDDVANLRREVNRFDEARVGRLEDSLRSLAALLGASIVPPWQTREEVERGDDMGVLYQSADDLELRVEWLVWQAEPGFEDGQVVGIEPPPGTALRRGSTVRVTINLLG
jgi:hypothetical protein